MVSAKDILTLVADELNDNGKKLFDVESIGDGKVRISGRFRLFAKKQEKKDSITQDSILEDNGNSVKPTVKATFSECKAKNPMKCRFHGAMYAKQELMAMCDMNGISTEDFELKRIDEGTYDFKVVIPDKKVDAFKAGMGAFFDENGLEPLEFNKENGYYSVMYLAEEELDPNELEEVETLKVDYDNADKSVNELSGIKSQYLSSEDLKVLEDEIANQRMRVDDMHDTLDMLGVLEQDTEDDLGLSYQEPSSEMPQLPPLPNSLDELTFVKGNLGGSTGPTLWQDADGNKFIIKTGGGDNPEDHVRNEYVGLKAYRSMGVFAPDAKLLTDHQGKTVMVENFVEGTPLGEYLDNATAAQEEGIVQQIRDTSYADIILGNWDCAGTADGIAGDYPNMMVVDGKLCRIDPGGWGRYRAQGGLKNELDWNEGDPNELFTMKKIGTSSDFIGDMSAYELAQQIDAQDFSNLLSVVPNSDKAVLQKRINTVRRLAARGRNYVEDGDYKNMDFVDDVLEMSFEAEKLGAKETLSYGNITYKSITSKTMKYGGCAADTAHSSEIDALQIQIDTKQDEINKIQGDSKLSLLGLDNIAHTATAILSKGKQDTYKTEIDDFVGMEGNLKKAKDQISLFLAAANADDGSEKDNLFSSFFADSKDTYQKQLDVINSALGVINEIKDNMDGNGGYNTCTIVPKIPHIDAEDSEINITTTKEENEKIEDLKYDIEQLEQEKASILQQSKTKPLHGLPPHDCVEVLCQLFNKRDGGHASWGILKDMLKYQGYDPWAADAKIYDSCHLLKICELEAMGVDWQSKPIEDMNREDDHEGYKSSNQYLFTPSGKPIYVGSWAYVKKANGKIERKYEKSSARLFNDTVHYIKKDPKSMRDNMRSLAAMKAIQSLIFENSKLEGATKDHVLVTRTLPQFITESYKLQRDKYNMYPSGSSESAAYGKSTSVWAGTDAMQISLPVSRLTGMFCWDDPYEHYSEMEFGINPCGLYGYVGDRGLIESTDHLFDMYNNFVQKNPKVTKSNSYEYIPTLVS